MQGTSQALLVLSLVVSMNCRTIETRSRNFSFIKSSVPEKKQRTALDTKGSSVFSSQLCTASQRGLPLSSSSRTRRDRCSPLVMDMSAAGLSDLSAPVPLSEDVFRAFMTGTEGKKAIFLDYDGTLREFVAVPSDAVPTPEMTALFQALDSCQDIHVHIVSGRDAEFLEEHFGAYQRYTLVSEHGYQIRRPGSPWKLRNSGAATGWKSAVRPIMEEFMQATPGVHVEEKLSALVWHYREAEQQGVEAEVLAKAKSLLAKLRPLSDTFPLEVSQGQKIIEAASSLVNKGQVVRQLGADYAKVLCAGDDKTDENMFKAAQTMPNAVSIKVGPAVYPDGLTSRAQYLVDTPDALRNFLKQISQREE